MSLRETGAITGIGETQYMRGTDRTPLSLQLEASLAAIADAGLKPTDIDGVIPYGHGAVAEDFITNFGIPDLRFSATTPMGGASAVAAIQCAVAAISAGICNHVLLSLGRTGYSGGRIGTRVQQMPQFRLIGEFEMPSGAIAPAQLYAAMARRHMELYGTTSRQFAEIAVTTRRHASLNPNAVFRTPITLADHQASRFVAEPFRLLDCCPVTDGAAALIITSAERARDLAQKPVYLLGLGQGFTHSDLPWAATMTTTAAKTAAERAYAMAGLEPKDIDVAELYDCFTYVVLVTLEDYGFCAKGEGGAFVEGGRIELGGALPVNTGGGLLSHGHASGALLLSEAAIQMRGAGGARQVGNAETAIVSGQCGVTGVNVCLIFGNHPN